MGLRTFRSIDPGYSRARRARIQWVRENIVSMIGAGAEPDEADIAELPASVWGLVRQFAKRGVAAFDAGEQGEARQIAEQLIPELDAALTDKWTPPREKPDRDLLDEIQGLRR